MRAVAQHAVFARRHVFPQERAAFFGMTIVAGLVDREGGQAGFPGTTVRGMAVTAAHLVFAQGMGIRQIHRGAQLGMALETHLLLTLT